MQQDDMKRKAQLNPELESATERDDEEAHSKTTLNKAKNVINRDDYIDESMAILSDYITLKKLAIKDE